LNILNLELVNLPSLSLTYTNIWVVTAFTNCSLLCNLLLQVEDSLASYPNSWENH